MFHKKELKPCSKNIYIYIKPQWYQTLCWKLNFILLLLDIYWFYIQYAKLLADASLWWIYWSRHNVIVGVIGLYWILHLVPLWFLWNLNNSSVLFYGVIKGLQLCNTWVVLLEKICNIFVYWLWFFSKCVVKLLFSLCGFSCKSTFYAFSLYYNHYCY